MAYVVVVFAIINSGFLLLAGMLLLNLRVDLMECVVTAVEDEIRKQDDRIEKRVAKVQGTGAKAEEPLDTPADGRVEVGRPYQR